MELSTSSSEQKKRLEYIDILECIAIFLVVFCHCSVYNFDIIKNADGLHYVRYFLRALISVNVPLFFFINGYLLFGREFKLDRHLRKTLRLTLITVVWSMLSAILVIITENGELTFKAFLVETWYMSGRWLWFMGMLIGIYILFPIFKSAYDHNEKSFEYFVIISAVMTFGNKLLCGALTVAANVLIDYPEVIRTNVFNSINPFQGIYWYDVVYFCAGGLVNKYMTSIRANLKKLTAAAIAAIPVAMLLLTAWATYVSKLNGEVWDIIWGGFDTVFTAAMVLAVFVISLNFTIKKPALKSTVEMVSKNTLGIYLVHEFFVRPTKQLLMAIPALDSIVFNTVYTIVVIALSMLTVWLIKKIPVVRKLLI